MKNNNVCIKCGTQLAIGENVTQYQIDHSQYVCRKCKRACRNYHDYQTGRRHPMGENRESSSFLGVYVAERVLSHIFKNVVRMPYGNPGYDFICGKGYLVDAKSSCRNQRLRRADHWLFNIRKNLVAEYFLCLAFDNRNDLTPEHIWLISAADINDHDTVCMSETRLDRWSKYEHPIDKVVVCCDGWQT